LRIFQLQLIFDNRRRLGFRLEPKEVLDNLVVKGAPQVQRIAGLKPRCAQNKQASIILDSACRP
jgi:hypothetical protein